jgi:membrane-associated phospholipid phosphatase
VAGVVDVPSAISRWFLFSDCGMSAQRHMTAAWTCVFALALIDAIWLPQSKLTFLSANWLLLAGEVLVFVLTGILIAVAFSRLRDDSSRFARLLRQGLVATELLRRTAFVMGAMLTTGVTLSYVTTAAGLPLMDSLLARFDQSLGFDWQHFLEITNSEPRASGLLAWAYRTTGWVTQLVIVWVGLTGNGERLAELLAILGLCTVGLCGCMLLFPAAGAFAYFDPASSLFSNYGMRDQMWTFGHTFNMLRDGSLSVIDLSALDGIVSFPSFHTILGILGIYAARDVRWLLALILPINVIMIIATMPVGGHHLADVLAGAGLSLGAITFVRLQKQSPLV